MIVYKQRYKPRTSRAFTKSDLTVYDSAGNTALNALTVYGKSEVVDGSIKSAGEGWTTVDLGTLTFILRSTDQPNYNSFQTTINNIDAFVSNYRPPKLMCGKFKSVAWSADWQPFMMSMLSSDTTSVVFTTPKTVTTVEQFQALISDVILAYQSTQGNAITIKTDNGSGIDGTMAVFETGTPLYGVSDTVRDVMQWNGSSGVVTKNCAKDRLVNLTWSYNTKYSSPFFIATLSTSAQDRQRSILSSNYIEELIFNDMLNINQSYCIVSNTIRIRDDNYTTVEEFVASLGDTELVYKRANPTTTTLTTAENESIAGLRTFAPTTHAQNNAQTDMTVNYTIRVPTI